MVEPSRDLTIYLEVLILHGFDAIVDYNPGNVAIKTLCLYGTCGRTRFIDTGIHIAPLYGMVVLPNDVVEGYCLRQRMRPGIPPLSSRVVLGFEPLVMETSVSRPLDRLVIAGMLNVVDTREIEASTMHSLLEIGGLLLTSESRRFRPITWEASSLVSDGLSPHINVKKPHELYRLRSFKLGGGL